MMFTVTIKPPPGMSEDDVKENLRSPIGFGNPEIRHVYSVIRPDSADDPDGLGQIPRIDSKAVPARYAPAYA